MCKRLIFLISFVLVLGLANYASAADANEIPAAAAAPIINGTIDAVWSTCEEYKCDQIVDASSPEDPTSDADLSASWWALWDSEYLYILVDVNDNALKNDNPGESWHDDSAEIMIDIGNDNEDEYGEDDYQYRIGWNSDPNVKDLEEYWHGRYTGVEFVCLTKGGNAGYTIEIKYPWETLDAENTGPFVVGTLIGFEIQINDKDASGGDRESKLGCFTDQDPWSVPNLFGTVTLAPAIQAFNPIPSNGATYVLEEELQWSAGKYAASSNGHDVYFGTSPTPGAPEFKINQTATEYDASSLLEPDSIYYWRIDEVNDNVWAPAGSPWQGDVWSFTTAPLTAHSPDPYDGEKWVDINRDLNWGSGWGAISHNLYLGTDPDNLEEKETGMYNNTYDPCLIGGPEGTTYYWRIDEYDGSIHTGDRWSFTTLRDGAGLKADYYSNITASGKIKLKRIDYNIDFDWGQGPPDPNVGDEDGDKWSVRWTGEVNIPEANTYTFTTIRAPVGDGVRLYIDGKLLISRWTTDETPGDEPYEDSASITLGKGMVPMVMEFFDDTQAAKAQLLWRTPYGPNEIIPRDAFFQPRRSVSPEPSNGATDVRSDPVLNWVTGQFADTRDVYFGTDEDEVTDTNANVLVDSNTRDVNYYDPGLLEFNTTYYWRVIDINALTPGGPWPSSVWSFTTGSYHIVDDMEKYNSSITDAWKTSAGGSVTTSTSPKMAGTVHEGDGYEAMAYSYNNSAGPFYSQAYAEADSPHIGNIVGKDWGLHKVKALSLWFRGQGNPNISGTHSGQYTITSDSRGMPSTGKAESFYFVYGHYNGNVASIYAKVLNVEKTDPYAKAGVMIRDDTNQDAKYGAVVVTPENSIVFQYRPTASGSATSVTVTTPSKVTAPCWVKVERTSGYPPSGGKVKGYYATTTGVPGPGDWNDIGSLPLTLGAPIDLGLCTTSTHYGRVGTSRISNVTTLPVTALSSSKDIGSVYNDPAPMYVVLEDSNCDGGIVYYPDANNPVEAYASATQIGTWTEWRIDLNDFNDQGVDLADVNKIYIGFGNKSSPTGSGIMYIDDIRLYLAEFYEPECPWDEDLVRDGVIDYNDLGQALRNWLMKDRNVTPVPPTAIPVSRYQLDGNADDTGNPGGHDGEPCGVGVAYNYTNWKDTPASLELTGDGSWIKTDANAADYGIDGNKSRTITAWAYARPSNFEEGYEGAIYEMGRYVDPGGQVFALRTQGEPNLWIAQHWGEDWMERSCDISFTYPSMNRWVHFAHVYDHDANTARIYADGYLVGELEVGLDTFAAVNPTDSDRNFGIGLWRDGYFDGLIDDVRIYNEVLDQNEIASLAGKTVMFTQPLHMLKTPDADSDLYDDGTMDFKDIAKLGKEWGKKKVWPVW